jgi:hypothetical protein
MPWIPNLAKRMASSGEFTVQVNNPILAAFTLLKNALD